MTKLFFDSIGVAEFLKKAEEKLGSVRDIKVLQLIHKGHPIRVVMTQEHYLRLLEKIDEHKAPEDRTYVEDFDLEESLEDIRTKFENKK